MLGNPYWAEGILLLLCSVIAGLVLYKRISPPTPIALLAGAAVRLITVALAYRHTPHDVASYFQAAGLAVLHGHDPMTALPRYQWNFLPMMPYVFAAELKTTLPWQLASKIVPVVSDLVTVVLVGYLAEPEDRGRVQILYALCPIAILVSAWHGQVEPTSIAFGIAALLLARKGWALAAGLVLGLAISSKTWPLVFVPAVLILLPSSKRLSASASAVVIVGGWFGVAIYVLHDNVKAVVHVLSSYRSFAGAWGWSGLLRYLHITGFGYAGPTVNEVQRIGTGLTLVAVGLVILCLRGTGPYDLTSAIVLAILAVAAGFGTQYLLWPVALLLIRSRPFSYFYILIGSCYAGLIYLDVALQFENSWLTEGESLVLVVGIVLELGRRLVVSRGSSGGLGRGQPLAPTG